MKIQLILFFASAVLFFACRDNSTGIYSSPDQPSDRQFTPLQKSVVSSDNSFGLKLFVRINATEQNKNVFISPFSVSMALGMALNGAGGRTLDSMKAVLEHSNFTLQEINDSYKNISALLISLDPKVTVNIANSVWYRNEFSVYPTFLDDCRTNFGAEVASLDFSAPSALQTINDWVNTKTNGKIPTILEEIPADAVLYLINAIYYKGIWTFQFDPSNTIDTSFTSFSGSAVPCNLMSQRATYAYLNTGEEQIIDLPYGDRSFSMTVILPKNGIFIDQYAAQLTRQQWDLWMNRLDSTEVDLFMPKFKLEYEKKLNDELIAMGMENAFSGSANFSRISSVPLQISEVKHKSFVEVNEEGTEAAAVTSIGFRATATIQIPAMRIDHPFIFAIREHKSGTILFIGKVGLLTES